MPMSAVCSTAPPPQKKISNQNITLLHMFFSFEKYQYLVMSLSLYIYICTYILFYTKGREAQRVAGRA